MDGREAPEPVLWGHGGSLGWNEVTSSPAYTTVSSVVGRDGRHMGSPVHRVSGCPAAGYSGTVPQFPPLETSMAARPFH